MSHDYYPAHRIQDGIRYHALTWTVDEESRKVLCAQTEWAGYDSEDERIELRELCDIYPDNVVWLWESLKEPYQVVNDRPDFVRWYISGGHALVTRELIERFLPWRLEPTRCVREGFSSGFTSQKLLPPTAFQKAPTPRLRMEVLIRDGRRCMICGQRPAEDTNVVLHAHHIRPFGKGGVTTKKNLITLCHTCHAGLEPHDDFTLYSLIEKDTPANARQSAYIRGVIAYRETVRRQFEELRSGKGPKRPSPMKRSRTQE